MHESFLYKRIGVVLLQIFNDTLQHSPRNGMVGSLVEIDFFFVSFILYCFIHGRSVLLLRG